MKIFRNVLDQKRVLNIDCSFHTMKITDLASSCMVPKLCFTFNCFLPHICLVTSSLNVSIATSYPYFCLPILSIRSPPITLVQSHFFFLTLYVCLLYFLRCNVYFLCVRSFFFPASFCPTNIENSHDRPKREGLICVCVCVCVL